MANTKRVQASATATNTARVTGVTASSYDAWGNSWGSTWGDAWRVYLTLSELSLTARVPGAPAANHTKRVTL